MRDLIRVELYKLLKRKIILFVLLFSCIPIFYGLGMYFDWSWVSFNGSFDLIQFVLAMWQLMFIIGVPMIVFMFVGSSLIATERAEGQIILQVTRVADKTKLIRAKFYAMLGIILFYSFSSLGIASIVYLLLVKQTAYSSTSLFILNHSNIELIIFSVGVLLFLILATYIAMGISVVKSTMFATIAGVLFYVVLSVAVRIPKIQYWIPGYLALSPTLKYSTIYIVLIYQLIICLLLSIGIVYKASNKFRKLDL